MKPTSWMSWQRNLSTSSRRTNRGSRQRYSETWWRPTTPSSLGVSIWDLLEALWLGTFEMSLQRSCVKSWRRTTETSWRRIIMTSLGVSFETSLRRCGDVPMVRCCYVLLRRCHDVP